MSAPTIDQVVNASIQAEAQGIPVDWKALCIKIVQAVQAAEQQPAEPKKRRGRPPKSAPKNAESVNGETVQ